jgi:hypothetical protein
LLDILEPELAITTFLGVVNQVNMDNAVVSLLTGPLSNLTNVGTFPLDIRGTE